MNSNPELFNVEYESYFILKEKEELFEQIYK